MENDRTLFATGGISLLTGGTVLAATAAQNSTGWGVVAGVFIAVGLYSLLAAFVESVPLFGRTEKRRQAKKKQDAIHLLMRFHTVCVVVRDRRVTQEQFERWFSDLSRFVGSAWGEHQRSSLGGGIWAGPMFYWLNDVESRLSRFIERVDDRDVLRTFDASVVTAPEWLVQETTPSPTQIPRFSEQPPRSTES